MPRPSHRVDLLFVPDNLEATPDTSAFALLKQEWRAQGRLVSQADNPLVIGGFGRFWLDIPGRLTLYANQQGGYYVRCPISGGNLARNFSLAVEDWRRGGVRSLACQHCGAVHALEAITLAPPGAFARGAVVFTNVGSLELSEGVREALVPVIGSGREVIRRVG